jgi:hypothetical protein
VAVINTSRVLKIRASHRSAKVPRSQDLITTVKLVRHRGIDRAVPVKYFSLNVSAQNVRIEFLLSSSECLRRIARPIGFGYLLTFDCDGFAAGAARSLRR